MHKKLIFIILLFVFWTAVAQDAPIKFKDAEAAKIWVKKNYENQESERYRLEKDKRLFDVYAIYGRNGSGIERVHGWFFMCVAGVGCHLLGMADLGGGSTLVKDPEVYVEGRYLVIKQDAKFIIKFDLAGN
ncbi:hypothetical protein LJR066_004300 [Acidovorax sp. LjRoot66]|uniref:hypothetical protein n=1 Tax=Acidovorax sp. LjRoot66 TaxID=3342334 RepID=UPI003ECEFBA6